MGWKWLVVSLPCDSGGLFESIYPKIQDELIASSKNIHKSVSADGQVEQTCTITCFRRVMPPFTSKCLWYLIVLVWFGSECSGGGSVPIKNSTHHNHNTNNTRKQANNCNMWMVGKLEHSRTTLQGAGKLLFLPRLLKNLDMKRFLHAQKEKGTAAW